MNWNFIVRINIIQYNRNTENKQKFNLHFHYQNIQSLMSQSIQFISVKGNFQFFNRFVINYAILLNVWLTLRISVLTCSIMCYPINIDNEHRSEVYSNI